MEKTEINNIIFVRFSSVVWLLIFVVFFTACQKTLSYTTVPPAKKNPPISRDSILSCHNLANWDSIAISNKLIGLWKWEFIECYWNPEAANSVDYKDLSVEIKTDKTVVVKDKEQIIQTAVWKLTKLSDGLYYKIEVSPIVGQLLGRLLFCENRVVFSDTYVDGCNNYFIKK